MASLFDDKTSVVLIDGKNFVFRNFYPHSKLKTSGGENTGVLFGCLNGLLHIAHKLPDSAIVFCWDGKGETWRHRLLKPKKEEEKKIESKVGSGWFDSQVRTSLNLIQRKPETVEKIKGYKATRNLNATAEQNNLRKTALKQVPELMRILKLLGVRQFEVDGLECDDLIGILTKTVLDGEMFEDVVIHSSDKDFYQLLETPGVRILRSGKEGMDFVSEAAILGEFGIGVKDWVKYRAIIGDDSDNIPNLFHGIGPKRGLKLLKSGLDASKKDYHDIADNVWMEAMEYSKESTDVREVWKRLRRNYLASHIVCDDQFYLFDYNVRRDIGGLVGTLTRDSFYRSSSGKTEEAYRWFGEWLIQKEMNTLRERKDEFFRLL